MKQILKKAGIILACGIVNAATFGILTLLWGIEQIIQSDSGQDLSFLALLVGFGIIFPLFAAAIGFVVGLVVGGLIILIKKWK